MTEPASHADAYAEAGVSIEAADKAIELMKGWVEKARRPEMIGGLGGFAGLFDASALTRYERPLLATSTDGVGTKVAIAQAMDVHDTIGFDLVGMVVDDLVVCGAEPLFMTDYIATGRVVPERIAAIVKGIAEACVEAGCALIGGETAEHPGLLEPDEYDVAGATTGVVEADELLGPGRVRPGDVVIAMEASGLHSNGYSLVRHVLLEKARLGAGPRRTRARADAGRGAARADPDLRQGLPGARRRDRAPTRCPTSPAAGWPPTSSGCCRSRWTPPSTAATWTPQPVFDLVRQVGSVSQPDLEATLNCGVGMVALLDPAAVDAAIALLAEHGIRAWVAGEVAVRRGVRGPRRAHRPAPRLVISRNIPDIGCAGTASQQVALGPRQY